MGSRSYFSLMVTICIVVLPTFFGEWVRISVTINASPALRGVSICSGAIG